MRRFLSVSLFLLKFMYSVLSSNLFLYADTETFFCFYFIEVSNADSYKIVLFLLKIYLYSMHFMFYLFLYVIEGAGVAIC